MIVVQGIVTSGGKWMGLIRWGIMMGVKGRKNLQEKWRACKPAAAIIVTAAVYFFSGKFGLSLAFVNGSASAVWPPTGIALAGVLLWGYRLWPGIFIGAFLVSITTQGSLATSLGIATGNTLEALVAAGLVRRFANGVNCFESAQMAIRFLLLAAFLSTMISATAGVTSLCLGHYAGWRQFWLIWTTWWIGDMTSNLVIAPLLMIWMSRRLPHWQAGQLLEGVVLMAILTSLSGAVFCGVNPFKETEQLEYLTIPPLLWATFRFGLHGAIASIFIVSGIALWGTSRRMGPFVTDDPNETLLLLQTFTGIVAMTILVLAAVISERRRFQKRLQIKDAISHAIAESAGLVEASSKILQVLCEQADWDLGAMWRMDPTTNKLFCFGMWQAPHIKAFEFDAATWQTQFAPGVGLPGRTWLGGKPVWVPDLTRDHNFPRASAAMKIGLRCAFCFPIKFDDETIGVIECFRREIRAPDIDFVHMLVSLGYQLGSFIERKVAEESLRLSEERYRLVVEDQTETICRIASDGTFTYVNDAFCRFFGRTKEELLGGSWRSRTVDEDLPEIEKQLATLSPSNRVVVLENRVYNSVGEVRWFQFVNRGFFDAAGVLVETQSVGRDITERKFAEALLRDSETCFKQVTESIREVFWMINVANTEMVYISPAYENIWGRTCASLYASPQDWLNAVHPEDNGRMREAARTTVLSGDFDEEYRIVRPDGSIRWIRARGFPVNDPSGKIYRVAGIAEDVTLRKRAEFDLALLAHGVESTSELICITDLEDRFVFSNPSFQKAFGYSAEEIIGKTPSMLFSPSNPPKLLKQILTKSRAGGWVGEVLDLRKDGTEFPVYLRTSQVRDHSGKVIALMGVAEDITKVKKAGEQLKALADIVQSSRDAIIRLTAKRIIVIWNKGAEELFGYTAAEAIGQNISLILPPDHTQEAAVVRSKVDRGEMVEIADTVRLHKDGTLRNVSVKISPIHNANGELIGSAAIIRDIAEKKQLENLLLEISANERQRIGYDLHDGLGQHLAGIAFKTKALEDGLAELSSPQAGEAGEIVRLLNDAIGQTRNLARMLAPVEVEANGLLAALGNLAAETQKLYHVGCVFESGIESLLLDAKTGMALYRIAQESLHNAINRGAAERVVIHLKSDENANICLSVRDSGKGFSTESKSKTGMGLRIMKHRASSLGGRVEIHSQIGKGTEVICYVPGQGSLNK
jgi:PAS domain S-box-containing protein